MRNELYQFRCLGNPRVIYRPEEMADVEAMRTHPEYEEVDAAGNVITKPVEQTEKRIPVVVSKPAPRPVAKKGRK